MSNTQNRLHNEGSVLVELSDDRLAEVEKAKRTGEAFVSVGARGSEIVDRRVLREETEKVSNANSSDPNESLPDYLFDLKNNVEDEAQINQQKAAEHSEVSAEVARVQLEQAVTDAELVRQDPQYFSKRIQAQQREEAARYSEEMAQAAKAYNEENALAASEVVRIRLEDLNDPNPVSPLARMAQDKVTDISESAASESLELKDRIIYGEESFSNHAKGALAEQTTTHEATVDAKPITPAVLEQEAPKRAAKSNKE